MSRDFEQLRQLRQDLRTCGEAGTKYYEYFLFSAPPCATATVHVSDFFSSRQRPASAPAHRANMIVWMFGGSTMQEHQTTDASAVLNDHPEDVFYDHGHVSAFSVRWSASSSPRRSWRGCRDGDAADGLDSRAVARPEQASSP